MEARPSGHKRNFSAYDSQQLAGFDPSGKAARPVEEQAAEGEAEPQEEQQHEEAALTESAAFSLTALRQAQESVIRQIDELQGASQAAGRGTVAARGAAAAAATVERWRQLLAAVGALHAMSWELMLEGDVNSLLASLIRKMLPSSTAATSLPAHLMQHASAFPPSAHCPRSRPAEAGLHFLDHMRAAFLERIAQVSCGIACGNVSAGILLPLATC